MSRAMLPAHDPWSLPCDGYPPDTTRRATYVPLSPDARLQYMATSRKRRQKVYRNGVRTHIVHHHDTTEGCGIVQLGSSTSGENTQPASDVATQISSAKFCSETTAATSKTCASTARTTGVVTPCPINPRDG